jgi:hypothetical protein
MWMICSLRIIMTLTCCIAIEARSGLFAISRILTTPVPVSADQGQAAGGGQAHRGLRAAQEQGQQPQVQQADDRRGPGH